MSISQSKWNLECDQQQLQQHNPKQQNEPSSENIHPHAQPQPRTKANEKSKNFSANIVIASGDRTLSKKFTSPHQTVNSKFSNQQDSKLLGFVNSFDQTNLSASHLDPMSLVPSPSRGIYSSPREDNQTWGAKQKLAKESENDQFREQDLKDLDFQLKFFRWIFQKVKEYNEAYPDRTELFLHLSSPDTQKNQSQNSIEYDFKVQIGRVASLVREIRKLREGILASQRRDSFAIIVYELSAELALEALDLAQLNTLLNHLVMDLYRKVSISDHHICWESTSMTNEPEKDITNFINHHRQTKEEVLNRRLMFARVFLLLPIVTRMDLSQFIEQFAQVSDILSNEGLQKQDSTNYSTTNHQVIFGILTSPHPKLLELRSFFKFVLRRNYVQLNRKFIKPKLQKIMETRALNNPITEWDELLFFVFLNLIRPNLIWKVICKSYYHLSLEDDLFIFNLLSLEFQNFDQLPLGNSDLSAYNVNQVVNSWLLTLDIQRNSKGIIQLK